MRACLLLILALLQPAPDPRLTAHWDSDHSATISWTQAARGCLSVQHATGQRVFLTCREKPGYHMVYLGGPQTDGAYRPAAGDVYVLETGGQKYSAPLRGRSVYFPVFRG